MKHSVAEVEAALRSAADSTGVLVVDEDGDQLAHRPPLPGGGAVIVVLGWKRPMPSKQNPGGLFKPGRTPTQRTGTGRIAVDPAHAEEVREDWKPAPAEKKVLDSIPVD